MLMACRAVFAESFDSRSSAHIHVHVLAQRCTTGPGDMMHHVDMTSSWLESRIRLFDNSHIQ